MNKEEGRNYFLGTEWEDPLESEDNCLKQYSVEKFPKHPDRNMSYGEEEKPRYILHTRICPVCGDELSKTVDIPSHWEKFDGKYNRIGYRHKVAYKKLKDFSVSRLCCKGECEKVAGQRDCDLDLERNNLSHKEEDRELILRKDNELEESKLKGDHEKVIKSKIGVLNQWMREYKEKYGESPFS